jgi:hypothetical protein
MFHWCPPGGTRWRYGPRRGDDRGSSLSAHPARLPPETSVAEKNENSARTVPLHPAIVAEGFLDYVKALPSNGALFSNLVPDRFGKRAGTGTKRIGRWIRGTVGITDTRIAPSYSWRHRFETKVRDFNIREDISNRLTGRRASKPRSDYDASEASDSAAGYGAFEIRTLARAIARLKNLADELPAPAS